MIDTFVQSRRLFERAMPATVERGRDIKGGGAKTFYGVRESEQPYYTAASFGLMVIDIFVLIASAFAFACHHAL